MVHVTAMVNLIYIQEVKADTEFYALQDSAYLTFQKPKLQLRIQNKSVVPMYRGKEGMNIKDLLLLGMTVCICNSTTQFKVRQGNTDPLCKTPNSIA